LAIIQIVSGLSVGYLGDQWRFLQRLSVDICT
jgi:hypothetical protein